MQNAEECFPEYVQNVSFKNILASDTTYLNMYVAQANL